MKLSKMASISAALVCRGTSFVEQVARVLNYCHIFSEENGLRSPREKTVYIVRDKISSDYHNWNERLDTQDVKVVCARWKSYGEAPMRLLDVVNELDKGFPSSQCLGATTLNDGVFIECDEGAALFSFVPLMSSVPTKMLCYTPGTSINLWFRYSMRYRRCTTSKNVTWWGLWTGFL